ncbi:hypothetical protein ACQZ4R_12440 [Agrobacterium vitis]
MKNEIVISTNDYDFKSMLFKMMGRGLRLSWSTEGHFLLNEHDIADIISKIEQRVTIQNDCSMTDFYAEFHFEDGSIDRIPNLGLFNSYRCLNNTICFKVKFVFAFLINFKERGIEKQSVDITIQSNKKNSVNIFEKFITNSSNKNGIMNINIEYTDITWANDIKNLFKNYCDVHIEKFPIRKSILRIIEDRMISIALFPISTLVMMITIGNSRDSPEKIQSKLDTYITKSAEKFSAIESKINFLIFEKNKINLLEIMYPIFILICIIFVFLFIKNIISNIPRSVIILSPEAKKVYTREENQRKRWSTYSVVGIILSIASSLAANHIDRLTMLFFR